MREVAAFLSDGKTFAGAIPDVGCSGVIPPLLLGTDSIGDPERFWPVVRVVGIDAVAPEKLEGLVAESFFADSWALVPEDGRIKAGFQLIGSGIRFWWFAHSKGRMMM